jgi:glucose/arabinose dehydrogenase
MPGFAQLAPDKVEASITRPCCFTARSSLLDLVFYEGDQFPAEYKGSLFVPLKGSWNRSTTGLTDWSRCADPWLMS